LDSSRQLKQRRPKDDDSDHQSLLMYSVWVLVALVLIGIIVGAVMFFRRRRKQPDSTPGKLDFLFKNFRESKTADNAA
jgi:uncharacterized membrane protein